MRALPKIIENLLHGVIWNNCSTYCPLKTKVLSKNILETNPPGLIK